MNWEEACNYLWGTSEGNTFTLRIVDGYVEHKVSSTNEWVQWCAPRADNVYYLNSYKNLGQLELFCGPMQPPPSKVILKIRQMEARRNHVQCGR